VNDALDSAGPREILDRKNAMRQAKASGWIVRNSSRATIRAARLTIIPVGIALVVNATAARAEDDRTFSEKFMDGFYNTIRGTNMDNRGIDYRERSPLVVPPKLDLPPPAPASHEVNVTNWPKDPDERQRKAVIEAKKKNAPAPARVQPVTQAAAAADPAHPINIAPPAPDPQVPGTTRPAYANDRNGTARTDPVYDQPGDLFTGGLSKLGVPDALDISNLWGGKKADTTVRPGTEPSREALTQPPAGYQTPSPNYPYAPESKGLLAGQSNPDRNPLAQRSSETSMVK
jgi:hypothetical protein